MAQPFDLRINGENVKIESGKLTLAFDTPNDGFVVTTVVNNNKLYKAISPYQAPSAQVYLDGSLKLTGKITRTDPNKTTTDGVSYDLHGWSSTFNFMDSALQPPYEYAGLTIHLIAIQLGKQTNTRIVHTGPDGGIFERVTAKQGQTGYSFLWPLAQQRQHVISNTNDAALLLQQADISQKSIGTIDENSPNSLLQKEFKASFDLRKRFRTYKLVGRRPDGNNEATATDKNITEPRHKLIQANDDIPGGLEENAQFQLKKIIIAALQQNVPVTGWYAPNGKLWTPGTLITLVSPTLFVPNGFTYFINQVDFSYDSTAGKQAVLTLIPKEIHSTQPIIEPWFEQ